MHALAMTQSYLLSSFSELIKSINTYYRKNVPRIRKCSTQIANINRKYRK